MWIPEVTAEIALDVIDEIVADENVVFGIDLTMGRGKTAAHAVVVHSKVMHADDAGYESIFSVMVCTSSPSGAWPRRDLRC